VSLLGKLRLVLYLALPGVLVYALWRMPMMPWPGFQAGCMDSFPILSSAVRWSALVGAIVLGGCLVWLGTGRSIPLVPMLVAGGAPWFATIGFGVGIWPLMMDEYGQGMDERARRELSLVLSAELQTRRLDGVGFTATLLLSAVLVLGVEALLEHRRSGPDRSRPGRWPSKTAAALVTAALGLCLLAGLDAWMVLDSLLSWSPASGFRLLEQLLSEWSVARGVYMVGVGGAVLGAAALLVRALLDARARRPVALRPTLLALCAGATLLLDSQLRVQAFRVSGVESSTATSLLLPPSP
jgi:multisubunit Na+/H+ antiporter MnhB subunit